MIDAWMLATASILFATAYPGCLAPKRRHYYLKALYLFDLVELLASAIL
jgi:hypothetical protein